ncbi:hypothetical protein [Alistipes sp.]|uniref:hypothetical protein n=1 Tax=Alistipes sp. TaxID=1872444 RepID=UPI003A8944E2
MRYRTLILILVFAVAAAAVRAQSLDAFKQRLAQPTAGSALFEPARVVVVEHGDAVRAVADAARNAQRLSYKGHRVCIFFDNGPDARNGALAAKELFEETFPGIRVYMVYESPWFSVSVGNCLTTEEAIILKGKVSATFPKAFLKNEVISVADLLD